jgi:hypothetical protein
LKGITTARVTASICLGCIFNSVALFPFLKGITTSIGYLNKKNYCLLCCTISVFEGNYDFRSSANTHNYLRKLETGCTISVFEGNYDKNFICFCYFHNVALFPFLKGITTPSKNSLISTISTRCTISVFEGNYDTASIPSSTAVLPTPLHYFRF